MRTSVHIVYYSVFYGGPFRDQTLQFLPSRNTQELETKAKQAIPMFVALILVKKKKN